MPAPKSPDSYEAYYVSLYRILGDENFHDEEFRMPRADEKAAATFRGRFYSYIRARELELKGKRRVASTEELRNQCLRAEAELARVRRYKALVEGSHVVYINRDKDTDEIYDILAETEMRLAEQRSRANILHKETEQNLADANDDIYLQLLNQKPSKGTIPPAAFDDPYEVPENPATPEGQTRDPAPGIKLEKIVENTVVRLKHGSIPRIALPMAQEEQLRFLELWKAQPDLPPHEITQSDVQLTITRLENLSL